MKHFTRAILWSVAMIGVALASVAGWVSEDFAQTMVIVLPIMAAISIRDAGGGAACALFSRKGQA